MISPLILGTPLSHNPTKMMLLGAGELGKEVAIEAQRLGLEVIAVDRYANAPAMQVAHRSHVISMLDGAALRALIEQENPDLIVPEIEAIHTPTLQALEKEGFCVIPTATAARLTMDRAGIRRLAAETLGLPTSPYQFAKTFDAYQSAITKIGTPCVVKPIMSSSGKGQSTVKTPDQAETAWQYAQVGGRAGAGEVIVEGFVPFDYEITLLTIRARDLQGEIQTHFCDPIGHLQVAGDYRESWQPQAMSKMALEKAQKIAHDITEALGGVGLFGVELFVRGDEVLFSEVSPRPHDTGLVTLISQNLSEFALHLRAILGLPIPNIRQYGAAASCAILLSGTDSNPPQFTGVAQALAQPDTQIRLFGKPNIGGTRRMGVALALGANIDEARAKAREAGAMVQLLA